MRGPLTPAALSTQNAPGSQAADGLRGCDRRVVTPGFRIRTLDDFRLLYAASVRSALFKLALVGLTWSGAADVPLASDPAAKPLPAAIHCPPGMTAIPGGTYEFEGEKVTVKDFCLDDVEVTAGDYSRCVKSGKCSASGVAQCSMTTYRRDTEERPINCVTSSQAGAFCKADGRRLPSAAEWRWAARGGPAGNTYPWGNDPPGVQVCWGGAPKGTSSRHFAPWNVSVS